MIDGEASRRAVTGLPPEAKLISIRPWTVDDAGGLATLYAGNWEEIQTTEPWRPPDFCTESGQRRRISDALSRPDMLHFVILQGTAAVGTIGFEHLVRDAEKTADLGYWVDRAQRGRGIASHAVVLAVEYAFSGLGLDRVRANVEPDNIASRRVLERTGFQLAGRHSMEIAGRRVDHLVFERVVADGQPPRVS
jgi:ribosomal-protein-alanine N-acetyltransferase